jgi:predicted dehydrogenase
VYAIGSSSNPQLAAAGVLDTATMTLSFASGAVAQIVMTRSSTYGYDNRIEIIGELGKLEVATPPQSSVVHASAAGIATDVLQFSFPQRFREAYAAEVDAAVACVESRKRGDTRDVAAKWPISFRDCIMAQTIAMAATESQVRGAPLQISSFLTVPCAAERSSVDQRIAVRAVGNGAFGAYIRNLALSDPCLAVHFDVLSPYTRSGPNALDWKRDVLESAAVDAVYVCSPDALHKPHAIACLAAGKHVLVEKPVGPDFAEVAACAKRAERVLMVGLHRRLDAEFLRMRGEVAQRWAKRGKFSVHIESRDPCSAESDDEARARFVLNNSCVHDVDMAAWLFPDATLRVVSAAYVPGVSGFELELEASSSAGSAAAASVPYTVSITISYSKQHASYVQRGGIRCAEGTSPVFGYDHFGTFDGGEGPAGLYKAAYVAEWKEWHERMSGAGSADFARKEALHLESYTRSFALLAEVESVCFAGEERKAKRAKVM